MPRKLNNINPLVDNFFSRRLGESNKVKRKTEDDENNKGRRRSYDKVIISDLGKLLTSIKKELQEQGNQKALDGFNSIMELIGHPPSNLVTVNFADISAALSEQNSPDFIRLFETAYSLKEADFNLKKWVNSFINLNPEQLSHHLDITNYFLKTDNSSDFHLYIDKINNLVLDQDIEREIKLEKLDSLLEKMQQFEGAQEVKTLLKVNKA